MMKKLLTSSCVLIAGAVLGQARLVINNNAYVVFDPNTPAAQSTYLVVDNPNANAITVAGTGANIVSERERNFIRWSIGTSTGAYSIPFTNPGNVKMPLTYTVLAAGSAGGSVLFSTYNYDGTDAAVPLANRWNNALYQPSDVTHMNNWDTGNNLTPGATNESGHVVDRFWIIDTEASGFAYVNKPDASIVFQYDAAEITAGNTIGVGNQLIAQRFNSGTNKWGDYLPTCVWNTAPYSVAVPAAGVIADADFFRSWTLSDIGNPLPVELVDFKGACEDGQVLLNWTTASERDNDYFVVEKSLNNIEWMMIGQVDGVGNSVSTTNYSYVDPNPTTMAYYRLIQTDLDRTTTISKVIAAGCGMGTGIEIVNAFDAGDVMVVTVSSSLDDVYDLTLLDAQGKVMTTQPRAAIANGITQLVVPTESIATGIYVVQLENSGNRMSRRVHLQ
ncbi:MAG: hypothetical protein IPJ87_11335 [Flavobacteriales bacterium]|nr:hypothetical protein [Flavobacteriales bacterium]MBK7942445.1 hypothetical protein [Flavobacteriales bacterium]MBK8948260.1 hypothetical protein [Flavobacteriales bacterium]MBK9699156.1 hypothetical protein [Flavobacteriales bacterium]